MIKFEHTETCGWQAAFRGMRNPMDSWDKSDSFKCDPAKGQCATCELKNLNLCAGGFVVGEKDLDLAMRLAASGTDHSKFRRFIDVYVDITAPLYWFKEFDTYKVGTVSNSCSTMHRIHAKPFSLDDFSCEHLFNDLGNGNGDTWLDGFKDLIYNGLETARKRYLETKDKEYWWQMIQLLPTSYNQRRTIKMNYEVLANIYRSRQNHKLDEWRDFCKWIESLPYSEIITGKRKDT